MVPSVPPASRRDSHGTNYRAAGQIPSWAGAIATDQIPTTEQLLPPNTKPWALLTARQRIVVAIALKSTIVMNSGETYAGSLMLS